MKYLGLALAVASISLGCLGRTNPEDDELEAQGVDDAGTDGAVGEDVVAVDTTPGVDTAKPDTAPPGRDTFIDFFDIFPIPDSGPIGECATCVATNCSKQVNTCLNDPVCRNGLACTVMKCLAGGGGGGGMPDLACVLGCFGGDFGKAAEAIGAFTCVTGKCGGACGGLIGGGLPGGPPPRDGGSGGGSDGGKTDGSAGGDAAKSSAMHEISPDELRSMDPGTQFDVPREAFGAWSSEIESSACAQGLGPCITH